MIIINNNEQLIEAVENRYKGTHDIELTKEQAQQIVLYEEDKDFGSGKYFFSQWEELDYDEVMLKKILIPLQFESYMTERPRLLKQIEESLIENDKRYLPQLNAAEERFEYYKNSLVPSLRKNLMYSFSFFNHEREKVDFLKSEYKKYLVDVKKQILVEHFRHSKTFKPIVLRLNILRYEQMLLLPDYSSFRGAMDVPTKAVADFLFEKLLRISDHFADAIKQTKDDLQVFNTNNNAKHIGEVKGWHTTIIRDEKEELMFVLLFELY